MFFLARKVKKVIKLFPTSFSIYRHIIYNLYLYSRSLISILIESIKSYEVTHDVRSKQILLKLGWKTLDERRQNLMEKCMSNVMNDNGPEIIGCLFEKVQQF